MKTHDFRQYEKLLKAEKGDTWLRKPSIANFSCRTPIRQLPYVSNVFILPYTNPYA